MSKRSDRINTLLEISTEAYKNIEDKDDIRAVRYFLLDVISNSMNGVEGENTLLDILGSEESIEAWINKVDTKISELKTQEYETKTLINSKERMQLHTKQDLILELIDDYDIDIGDLVEIRRV